MKPLPKVDPRQKWKAVRKKKVKFVEVKQRQARRARRIAGVAP